MSNPMDTFKNAAPRPWTTVPGTDGSIWKDGHFLGRMGTQANADLVVHAVNSKSALQALVALGKDVPVVHDTIDAFSVSETGQKYPVERHDVRRCRACAFYRAIDQAEKP